MGGWAIIVADIIVMANLAQIAGSYTYTLFGFDTLAASVFWSTVAGIIWIAVMTYICYRGIEVSARLQYALLGIEIVTLVAFAVFAIVKVYAGDAPPAIKPSLDWLSPERPDRDRGLVTATLIAVFIYWGWDTAVATNEEADDPASDAGPGRGDLARCCCCSPTPRSRWRPSPSPASARTGIGLGNVDNADDVFAAMGESVFGGGTVGWIMVHLLAISVLTSASASTQTTILPTARTSLSMAVFKAAPARFARIHPKYLTPTESTIWMGGASRSSSTSLLTLISENILADTIAAVGLLIAFYYGLTGFACVWFYRKTMWPEAARHHHAGASFPVLGGLSCWSRSSSRPCKLYAAPDWGCRRHPHRRRRRGLPARHRVAAARVRHDVHLAGRSRRRTSAARRCPSATRPTSCWSAVATSRVGRAAARQPASAPSSRPTCPTCRPARPRSTRGPASGSRRRRGRPPTRSRPT